MIRWFQNRVSGTQEVKEQVYALTLSFALSSVEVREPRCFVLRPDHVLFQFTKGPSLIENLNIWSLQMLSYKWKPFRGKAVALQPILQKFNLQGVCQFNFESKVLLFPCSSDILKWIQQAQVSSVRDFASIQCLLTTTVSKSKFPNWSLLKWQNSEQITLCPVSYINLFHLEPVRELFHTMPLFPCFVCQSFYEKFLQCTVTKRNQSLKQERWILRVIHMLDQLLTPAHFKPTVQWPPSIGTHLFIFLWTIHHT